MTWLRSLRFQAAAWIAVGLTLIPTACAAPIPTNQGSQAPKVSTVIVGQHCADLLAAALASPNAAVNGAFDCQSPALVANAQDAGVKSDADIEGVAQGFGFTSATYIGGLPGAFTYLMAGANQPPVVLVVWTEASGLVTGFERAAHP